MPAAPIHAVEHYLRVALQGCSDGELLDRFAQHADAAAFEALLGRHGPMVLGVCRRVLGNAADAEDAFQATFFALARQARAVGTGGVAGWLHAVARRTACKALARRPRHRPLDPDTDVPGSDPFADVAWRDMRRALDEELGRLPDRLRGPLVLCYLDGLTRDEAAHRLGWSLATLKRRLEEGRNRLRDRLGSRGLAPACLVAALVPAGLRAAVPLQLLTLTASYALAPFAHLPPAVRALTEGVPGSFGLARKVALLVAAVVMASVIASGLYTASADPLPPTSRQERPAEPPRVDAFGDPLPDGVLHRFGSVRFREGNHQSNSALSLDGQSFAVGSWNGITVFDLATGKVTRLLKGCGMINAYGGLSRLALSPDCKQVAYIFSGGSRIAVRDLRSGEEIRVFGKVPEWHDTGFPRRVPRFPDETDLEAADHYLAPLYSLDGKELILVGRSYVHFRDAATGTGKRKVAALGEVVAISADQKWYAATRASSEKGQEVVVGDMATGKQRTAVRLAAGPRDWLSLAFSPDGKVLAVAVGKTAVYLWDAETGVQKAKFEPPEPERSAEHFGLQCLTFSADGRTLFVGSHKGIFRWDTTSGRQLPKLSGHSGWNVYGLHALSDGKQLVSVGGDSTVRRWNVGTGEEVPLPDGYAWYTSIAYAPDGKTVAISDGSGKLDLWSPVTGQSRASLRLEGLHPESIAFAPDGKVLAFGRSDGTVRFVSAATGEEKRILRLPKHPGAGQFGRLVFSADGRRMLSGLSGGPLHLWNLESDKPVWEAAEGGYSRAAFSSDGRTVAIGIESGPVTLRDAGTGAVRARLNLTPDGKPASASLAGLGFPAGGRSLLTCHQDGSMRFWDPETGKLIRTAKAPHDFGWDVTLSPDGKWLAEASGDYPVRIWEAATGRKVLELAHEAHALHAIISPDGRSLLTSTRTNGFLWPLRPSGEGTAEWETLTGDDAAAAYRAGWVMVTRPGTCRLLRKKVGGRLVLDEATVARHLAALDSDGFAERERATRALAEQGRLVEPWLRKALAGTNSPEVRRRLEGLLGGIPAEPSQPEIAQLRAVWVLELIGSGEAVEVLREWASATEGVGLTDDAKRALTRLGK